MCRYYQAIEFVAVKPGLLDKTGIFRQRLRFCHQVDSRDPRFLSAGLGREVAWLADTSTSPPESIMFTSPHLTTTTHRPSIGLCESCES